MIYCIGESLYDIVFNNGKPEWAVPGGGMLNCAVSLGHAGTEIQLITELGNDRVGHLIRQFLEDSNVKTDYLRVSDINTTLALAFLDQRGNAEYQFYKIQDKNSPDFTVPDFKQGDLLIYGSLYSVDPRNRGNIFKIAVAAKNAGAIIIYDPNFRKTHLANLDEVSSFIIENIGLADIVRGSDEDFMMIANARNSTQAFEFINEAGGKYLIVTQNSQGVDLFTGKDEPKHFDAIPVKIVSTIGAGDAFNAGLAYQIHQYGRIPSSFEEWKAAISKGLEFAAEVCSVRENYIKP